MRPIPNKWSWVSTVGRMLPALVAMALAACAALPFLVPPLLEFAGNLLMTAANNYTKGYAEVVTRPLLEAMVQPSVAPGSQQAGAPYPQDPRFPPTPVPSSSGYLPPGFPPGPGAPYDPRFPAPQPGYPTQPMPPGPQVSAPCGVYPNPPCPAGGPPPGFDPNFPPNHPMPGGVPSVAPPYDPRFPAPQAGGGPYPTSPYGGVASPQATGPLALDLALLRKSVVNGVVTLVPSQDGEVLRDGRGNPQAGDKFKIVFRSNAPTYVYVVSIDGSGWAQGLFPSKNAPVSNPIAPNVEYSVPQGALWHSLDQFRGVETLYVVGSRHPRPDIEAILTTIAGRERHPSATPQQEQQAPIIPNGYGGAQPGPLTAVPGESGHVQQVMTTTYMAGGPEQDLRITRWFRHE